MRRLHISECTKFKIQKIKHLFITIKVQLITISNFIPYVSEINSTSSSLKKKKPLREEEERKKRRRRKKKERNTEGKRGKERRKERKKGE